MEQFARKGLGQHVDRPMGGVNILDNILSTNDALISNINIGQEFSSSNHKIVNYVINLGIQNDIVSDEEVY